MIFFKGKGRFGAARAEAISTGKVSSSCQFDIHIQSLIFFMTDPITSLQIQKWIVTQSSIISSEVNLLEVLPAGIWIIWRALCTHQLHRKTAAEQR